MASDESDVDPPRGEGAKRRKTAAAPNPEHVVHVVAFGDSLTAGGFGSRPYPAQLEELLNANASAAVGSETFRYRVHNLGICGESTEAMVERLPQELQHLVQRGCSPSFVLLLGGTNDLGHMTPQEILQNLAAMRDSVAEYNAKSAVLAIPRTEDGLGPVARLVNRRLRADAAQSGSTTPFLFVDVTIIGEEHLCDGVHFTSKGYRQFAELAFAAIKPFL